LIFVASALKGPRPVAVIVFQIAGFRGSTKKPLDQDNRISKKEVLSSERRIEVGKTS
jgi:hypothetical protein